jgi:hypothetical protein
MTSIAAARYAAFISYSHKDAAAARSLHRRLESYRIPRRLAGGAGDHGSVPARLTPIFRDRDELPAAGDLSEKVRAALAASDGLIVVCSPNAAASPWVAREIEAFRELNPGRPVLAAIVDGEPVECFPLALSAAGAEPLAADLRRSGDGRRLGFLKLVAGLTGVGLDALVQRDAARQLRRVTAVTLVAIATTVVMAVLTIVALNARREADRQRDEAERMVDFMQGEQRVKLKEVGRLDAMTTTNQAVLGYYERQQFASLPAASVRRFASALHASGEDDVNRDGLDSAQAKFNRAFSFSAPLLASAPRDPERVFTHAQSEFWIGSVEYYRFHRARAEQAWKRYEALAHRLLALEPASPRSFQQMAYAEGNFCTIAMEKPVDLPAALRWCTDALTHMERAAKSAGDGSLDIDLVNRHAWLGGIYAALGDHDREAIHLDAQERLLKALLLRTPLNLDCQDMWLVLQTSVARREIGLGQTSVARTRLTAAQQRAEMMVLFDPSNKRWERLKRSVVELVQSINRREEEM